MSKVNGTSLKAKVRQVWSKLTDDDVENIKGNWEELSGRLQKTYGYTKDQAAAEIEKFKNSQH
ncbi:MAG: CsbD family protein [Bdellovibrionales bacterium]